MIEFGQVPNENAQEGLKALFRFRSDKKTTNLSLRLFMRGMQIAERIKNQTYKWAIRGQVF